MSRREIESVPRHKTRRVNADHGPEERWQHSGRRLEITERAGVMAARAMEENIIDILALRRVISDVQREAALRFKLDFYVAGMEIRLAGSYNPAHVKLSPVGPWDERNEIEEAAYQRWRNAVRALGLKYSDAVITVACYEKLPKMERMSRLVKGLEILVEWYGMKNK